MEMKAENNLKFFGGKFMAVIPLILFVISCIILFVVLKDYSMISLCVGGYCSIIAGSLLTKNQSQYWNAVVKGMASETVQTLALILFIVGMFGKMMTRAHIAYGFVWIGNSLHLTGGAFTGFTFFATCILSMSTGTSIGTLFTAFPILYPAGILLGSNPVVLAGAILSGAIFGDNVAPISDTTIASASSQEYKYHKGTADIGGVVATRMKYALVAAAIALLLFIITGGTGQNSAQASDLLSSYVDPHGLIMLIPVALLLVISVKTQNIFLASTVGIISGTILGLISNVLSPSDVISMERGSLSGFLVDGINNMIGTVGYLYAVAGIIGILNESGAMDAIIDALLHSRLNKTVTGSEIIMMIGMMISSICLGSANGPAIIMFGPIANEIGKDKDLHPYRRANLLDGFASTLPVIIPVTSSFIFITLSCVTSCAADYDFISEISPVALAGRTYHCIALFFVLLFAVITGWGRKYESKSGEMTSIPAEENVVC